MSPATDIISRCITCFEEAIDQTPLKILLIEQATLISQFTQGIHTKLGVPYEWNKLVPRKCSTLEWTILKGRLADFVFRLPANDPPRWLSCMCVKLIVRFARIDIVEYLEVNHKDLFWSAFGHELLPVKASAVFPRTEVLSWWNKSVSFLTKVSTFHNTSRALYTRNMNGTLRLGYVRYLRLKHLPYKITRNVSRNSALGRDWQY